MEAAIRFSQHSLPHLDEQYFLKVDVAGRALQVYNIRGKTKGSLKYDRVYASNKLQPFRAFDWHPSDAAVVAIGQTGGEASLVNLADPQQTPVAFAVRSQRSCNAVGLNTKNLIAIGLDKVRNDFCLNIWDINQRRTSNEPLHKLAGGEPITSLRFFQDQPQLLAAGLKGQFIRVYDLRESTSSSALQFQTRCVNNIALDTQDENYLASCMPATCPTVSIWDRRMISRTNIAQVGFGNYVSQADKHPEASAELRNVVAPQGQIWGLRFSKTHRGCLGVLSSTGQLRMLNFAAETGKPSQLMDTPHKNLEWHKQEPCGIFLDHAYNFSNAYFERPEVEEAKRIVSFDFTTSTSKTGAPKIVTLSGEGLVEMKSVPSSRASVRASPLLQFSDDKTKHATEAERMATQELPLSALTQLKTRCEAGYLLDASRNVDVVKNDSQLTSLWRWLQHAQNIASNQVLVYDGIDLSFLGVFAFWMEEIDVQARNVDTFAGLANMHIPSMLREITRRLHLARGKGCPTEYPHNRALCLYILGLPWTHDKVLLECEALVARDEPAQAAALALFAGELKIAQKVLKAKGSTHSHKLLAMALVGAKNRRLASKRGNANSDAESDSDRDEEWEDLVTSVAEDLTDCYARAILAYVKSGSWADVVNLSYLPLQYRISVALRHFEDSKLTRYLSSLSHEVITTGNLEGIVLTGLGTAEGIHLLQSYTRLTNDTQTATLAMSFAAASDRFLPATSPEARTVHVFRDTYKTTLLSQGLKFDKARFEVALARINREYNAPAQVRRPEQVRLVCTHCNQAISQFGHDRQVASMSAHMTDTPTKHPLAPEKAAVAGVVCPKCGRHLPRCGVCDHWLGTPDETFSKWYKPPRLRTSVDLSSSMVGSTVTTIGPNSKTSSALVAGPRGSGSITGGESTSGGKKLTTADLPGDIVEVVDEDMVRQEKESKWYEAMHKFTVFCSICSHGFHAEHARQWFDGVDGRAGHRVCPVPLCECLCKG